MGNKQTKKKEDTKKEDPKVDKVETKEEPKKETVTEVKKDIKEEPKKDEIDPEVLKKIIELFTTDPIWASTLTSSSGASVHEKLGTSLVNISFVLDRAVSLHYKLIDLEFTQRKEQANTILKVNSIVSKMMGKYTRKVGDEYLKTLLSDLINELSQSDVKFECNPSFLKVENPEEQAQLNFEKLQEWSQKILDRILDENQLDGIPRELRAICSFIEKSGEALELVPEVLYPMIGGFIILRYIAPGISTPNNVGILKDVPSEEVRGNLTYLAKVFQKLGNLETFGDDTKHLQPMNTWLEKNKELCLNYLKNVSKDPKGESFEDLKKNSEKEISVDAFNMEDLKLVYKIMKDNNKKLLKELSPENGEIAKKLLSIE